MVQDMLQGSDRGQEIMKNGVQGAGQGTGCRAGVQEMMQSAEHIAGHRAGSRGGFRVGRALWGTWQPVKMVLALGHTQPSGARAWCPPHVAPE